MSVIIRSYKSAVTKLAGLNGFTEFAWQERFYDHIIQDEKTFNRIREYIFDNPVKWELDKDNPSNLTMSSSTEARFADAAPGQWGVGCE